MQTKLSFTDALRQTHNALLGHLHFLDLSLRPPITNSPPELRVRLEKVRTHLLDHFRFEEDGGYMEPVLKEEPRLDAEVKNLLDEHIQLARGLDAIVEEFREAEALQELLCEKVRDWLKLVHRHEAHENRLVQEVFLTDQATGD